MILAFPAWRRGFCKTTGSVIDEAFARGHQVHLIHRDEDKPGERVTMIELARRWPAAWISDLGQVSLADALIGPNVDRFRPVGFSGLMYSLDYAWEQVTMVGGNWPTLHLCWASLYQQTLHRSLSPWRNYAGEIVTGSTMLDDFGSPSTIATDVLLFSLKFPRNAGLWRHTWYRYVGYFNLMTALRHFCDRTRRHLIVKTREKNNDPWFVRWLADEIITDDGALWPHVSLDRLRSAALAVHFQSGAALEAASLGVPQLSVHIPHPHLRDYPAHHEVYEASPGMQDWPGVVVGLGWEAAIGYLEDLEVPPPVNREARAAYVKRFLEFDDGRAASRVLDVVESGGS